MNADTPTCPRCTSAQTVENGHIHNGKQNHRCKGCSRRFVEGPQNRVICPETKKLIDKLLLERLPLAGIARVAEVSEPWLQNYVDQKYGAVLKRVQNRQKKGRLGVQCDEIWSFAGLKELKKWIWLALDTATREIVGVFIGSRGKAGAKGLRRSLPGVYPNDFLIQTHVPSVRVRL